MIRPATVDRKDESSVQTGFCGSVMSRLAILLILSLSGCVDPRLNAGISIGAGGVSVTPSVSGRVGGVGVTISP